VGELGARVELADVEIAAVGRLEVEPGVILKSGALVGVLPSAIVFVGASAIGFVSTVTVGAVDELVLWLVNRVGNNSQASDGNARIAMLSHSFCVFNFRLIPTSRK
jgi:hypothetical protein